MNPLTHNSHHSHSSHRFFLACSLAALAITTAIAAPPKHLGFSTNYMDRSVSPGSDFYQYAVGAWAKNNPVPADQSRWGSFTELAERNWYLVHEILDQAAADAGSAAPSPRRQVGDFFASAIATNQIEQQGLQPIDETLRSIDQAASVQDLFKVLAGLHERNIDGLFGAGVSPDEKNSSIYAFELGQGGLSLPDRDYYLSDKFADQRQAYQAHVAKMFGLLGDTPDDAKNHAATVLDLETLLAKASRSRVDLRDPIKNYNKFSNVELFSKNQQIPWSAYFVGARLTTNSGSLNASQVEVPYEIVGQPEFFDALENLLRERPLSEWKTYLRWHTIHASAPFLRHDFEDENFAFFGKVLSGRQDQEPRWKRAARSVDQNIGEALGQLYVEKYFPPQAKSRMNELVQNIKAAFFDRLQKLDWMTDATRAKAMAKFDRFTHKIGCPTTFRDYSAIEVRPNDYLGNIWRASSFETRRQLARIGKPVDRTEWHMTPITVNAYFSPTQNEIVFPAGILQPPFFDFTADDAVNYGAIGVVIGHEITHGYDDQGRQFDADGNLHAWWTEADAKAFEARAQKVVDEYDAFEPLPGLHVNGKLTLGENIADLGGVAIAYEALQRALAKDPAKRVKIDGLTPEQRFFISFAQVWRTNIREAEQRRLVTVDPHSPGRFRATGPLVNFQVFYDAFAIATNAPMWQPIEKRAKIW